jgi:threonine/homoserine efflux transporter RhtA
MPSKRCSRFIGECSAALTRTIAAGDARAFLSVLPFGVQMSSRNLTDPLEPETLVAAVAETAR